GNLEVSGREPARKMPADVRLAALGAPARHHRRHEAGELVPIRQEPPRGVIEVLVNDDDASWPETIGDVIEKPSWVAHERKDPSTPGEAGGEGGQRLRVQIDAVELEARQPQVAGFGLEVIEEAARSVDRHHAAVLADGRREIERCKARPAAD